MTRTVFALTSVLLAALALWLPAMAQLRMVLRDYVPTASIYGHAAIFAALTLALWWAWGRRAPGLVIALLASLMVGLELAQGLLPNRAIEAKDILANGTGVLLGLALAVGLAQMRRIRKT